MDAKARTKMGYDLFNKGDMETFFKEMVDENTTWTFPGKEGVHPLSGVHKGPQAMMAAMGKIPATWSNFHVTPIDMISEGNKVFQILPPDSILSEPLGYTRIKFSELAKDLMSDI